MRPAPEFSASLQEDEIQEISREISRLGEINPEVAEAILEDFYRLTLAQTFLARGGPEFAKKLLVKALEWNHPKNCWIISIFRSRARLVGFDNLQKADPVQLSKFIQSEQPQTIALVLAHLNSSQAAALLSSLPSALRADVVYAHG